MTHLKREDRHVCDIVSLSISLCLSLPLSLSLSCIFLSLSVSSLSHDTAAFSHSLSQTHTHSHTQRHTHTHTNTHKHSSAAWLDSTTILLLSRAVHSAKSIQKHNGATFCKKRYLFRAYCCVLASRRNYTRQVLMRWSEPKHRASWNNRERETGAYFWYRSRWYIK